MQKKRWFKEGKIWICYCVDAPYEKDNIDYAGVPYEDWVKLEFYRGY